MPSRVKPFRRNLELGTRSVALAILAYLFLRSVIHFGGDRPELVDSTNMDRMLLRWSTTRAPERIHATFDHTPAGPVRDWLAALNRAGSELTWDGAQLVPSAISVEPVADPQGGVRAQVAVSKSTPVILRDELGTLDTVNAQAGGATFKARWVMGAVEAVTGGSVARNAARDSLTLKQVLVLGRPSWESKFVIRTLEERGWKVATYVPLALKQDILVRQNEPSKPDTSKYAAVIALDSVAGIYAEDIVKYVKSGGGVIIAGDAVHISGLKPLLPGTAGERARDPEIVNTATDTAERVLAIRPIKELHEDAIALERRHDSITVAARRVGAGRVVQLAYDDTWKWRMTPASDAGVGSHRGWWANAVAGIAFTPRRELPPQAAVDPAPLANLVNRLGLATEKPSAVRKIGDDRKWNWPLFITMAVLLLVEWGSRRLRGAK
jgi:hypothetical protein